MSQFLGHNPCPKCGSKDNLAEYTNNYYCFGCGYNKIKNDLNSLRQRLNNKPIIKEFKMITTIKDIPQKAMKWLLKYDISSEDAIKYKMEWSPLHKVLVLIRSRNYWQGRNFSDGAKYKSQGQKPIIVYGKGDKIVLVEDVLSAIKVARLRYEGYCAIPLLGSTVSTELEQKLTASKKPVTIWLDRDKAKQAIKIKNNLKAKSIAASVVITAADPKEYSKGEILEWLKNK